jgi:hypothetical protein
MQVSGEQFELELLVDGLKLVLAQHYSDEETSVHILRMIGQIEDSMFHD